MDETGRPTLSDVTEADERARRIVDYSVAFNVLAALGALVAAIAPALMATADAMAVGANDAGLAEEALVIQLRGSISAYWNVDPSFAFWLPFTAAAVLLVVDAFLSVISPNRFVYGRRYQNFILGGSLALLTWFNKDDSPWIHFPAAYVFFLLFAAVMAYGALLGLTGRRVGGLADVGNRQAEKANGIVSLIFFALLGVGLLFFWIGWINFYFFELYALVSFALHYVLSGANPFPYNSYEFRIDWLNDLLRKLKIMKS